VDWPLFDLRLRCRDVGLRAVRENDLEHLGTILPGDVGHDPRLELFDQLSDAENERRLFYQGYWRALGTWSPSSWRLHMAVEYDGELVGVQTLEGEDFLRLRTVDSASWLVPANNGVGLIVETGGVATLQRLRLTADRWPHGGEVTVDGFPPCRPWFGLA
jgi:hypothetical protein